MSHHEELRWVLMPDGAHRSRSRGTPGYERDLLREGDSKILLGPTESRPADPDELFRSRTPKARPAAGSEFGQQLGNAIGDALSPYIEAAVEYGVDAAFHSVERLVKWAKRKLSEPRVVADSATDGGRTAELVTLPEVETLDASSEVGTDLDEPLASMSGEEYRARLLAALAAEQFAAEQKRRLANVRVEDDALPPELQRAVKAALEGSISSLDEETLAVVVEFLDGARTAEGNYLLLSDAEAEGLRRELGDRT